MINEQDSAKAFLDVACRAHLLWKDKLISSGASGEKFDVATIKKDDCCELGKWLQGEGKRAYGTRFEFQHLLQNHREFHLVTSVVAEVANGKNLEQLSQHMNESSHFVAASLSVGLAIKHLKMAIANTSEQTGI